MCAHYNQSVFRLPPRSSARATAAPVDRVQVLKCYALRAFGPRTGGHALPCGPLVRHDARDPIGNFCLAGFGFSPLLGLGGRGQSSGLARTRSFSAVFSASRSARRASLARLAASRAASFSCISGSVGLGADANFVRSWRFASAAALRRSAKPLSLGCLNRYSFEFVWSRRMP